MPAATRDHTPTISIIRVITHWPHFLFLAGLEDVVADHATLDSNTIQSGPMPGNMSFKP
jgi:hypothetical protein